MANLVDVMNMGRTIVTPSMKSTRWAMDGERGPWMTAEDTSMLAPGTRPGITAERVGMKRPETI